jgi:hypothetical protein
MTPSDLQALREAIRDVDNLVHDVGGIQTKDKALEQEISECVADASDLLTRLEELLERAAPTTSG